MEIRPMNPSRLARPSALLTPLIAIGVTVVLMPWAQSVRAGLQLEEEGLAIYGTVRYVGTLDVVQGAKGVLTPLPRSFSVSSLPEVTTDRTGRFVFDGLSPGRYSISLRYPNDSESFLRLNGRELELQASGLPSDINLWMLRLSRISGRVLDADDSPLPGICVDLQRRVWFRERFALVPSEFRDDFGTDCRTDEDGRFTVLAPVGEYYLRARTLDIGGVWSEAVRYYPGVMAVGEALPVVVGVSDTSGFDIRFEEADSYRVRFRVDIPEYLPGVPEPLVSFLEEGEEQLTEARIQATAALDMMPSAVRVSLDTTVEEGSWVTPALPPGQYDLLLKYMPAFARSLRDAMGWEIEDPEFSRLLVIGRVSFGLEDEDIDLGTIPAAPKTDVEGRLVFRNMTGTSPYSGEIPSQLGFEDSTAVGASKYARVEADSTFTIYGMHPGVFDFLEGVLDVPDGWYLASIRSGSREVLLDGLQVGSGMIPPLEVVFGNDAGRVDGSVREADGGLVPDARVVLIPPLDRRRPMASFPSVAAGAGGGFRFESVPPGDYRMLAFDPAGRSDLVPYWESPDFLRQYELRGELITVDPGARLTISPEAIPLVE
jgi:hypothetical protein